MNQEIVSIPNKSGQAAAVLDKLTAELLCITRTSQSIHAIGDSLPNNPAEQGRDPS